MEENPKFLYIVKVAEVLTRIIKKLETAKELLLKAKYNEDEDIIKEAVDIVCLIFNDCMKCPLSDFDICDHYEDVECSIDCYVCARLRFCAKKLSEYLEEHCNVSFCELVVDPKLVNELVNNCGGE